MNGFQNPYVNPYGFMPFQQSQQAQLPSQQVVKVNGENGARIFQMGANSSALLLDESGLMVWLVTSDGAGYKTVSAYDIKPHQEAPKPDYNTLENRIERLEMIINGNPWNSSADSKKPSHDAERKADDGNAERISKSTGNAKSTAIK